MTSVLPAGPRLADLLDALGALLEVALAPRGLDVPVAEPLLYDTSGGPLPTRDDVALLVGLDASQLAALDAVDHVGRLGAAAAILKPGGELPDRVLAAAAATGLALLTVPADTSWGQLLSLLRTALAARGQIRPDSAEWLSAGDLFGLANAIAATVGGATTIEDMHSNVLAYSNLGHPIDEPRQHTILGRQVPASWSRALTEQGIFRELYRSRGVLHVDTIEPPPEAGDRPPVARRRFAIAMRTGDEPLGSIWVVEGDRGFTAEAAESLRSAAQVAAIHLLHHRRAVASEPDRRAEQLRAVLAGTRNSVGAARLRVPAGVPLVVLVFTTDSSDGHLFDRAVGGLEAVLTLHLEVFRRHAYVASVGESVYVLLCAAEAADPTRMHALADDLRQRAERQLRCPVLAGVGAAVADLACVPRSRDEAEDVLAVLRTRGRRSGHVAELRSAIALHRLQALARHDPAIAAGKVAALVAHDAAKGTGYAVTLRAYLDFFGDVVAAAASLYVHRNTFRYRLGRLADIAQLDLTDPDERLIAHFQLRLLDGSYPAVGQVSKVDNS
jgi:DNA-binding PucR family transcriptional regulator